MATFANESKNKRRDNKWGSSILAAVVPGWISFVTRNSVGRDFLAGLTGATLVLPQAVAFAAIAGLPPEYGFYTAIIPTIVAALTGSSLHAISGPTTAISALVFSGLSGTFVPGSGEFITAAIVLAFLVGLIQIGIGVSRLGGLVDFVSHSVMTGFVAAAACLIALSQIGSALGLPISRTDSVGELLLELWRASASVDVDSVIIALTAVATGIAVRLWRPGLPNYLIALVVATGASLLIGGGASSVATVGPLQGAFPLPDIPDVSLHHLRDLGSSAVAIAVVGLLEALAVSRAIAMKSGQMIDGNRECVGQGASNLIGSFFHCYPGSASFTRSGVNYDAGAKTPLSAIFAAVFLLLILLFIAPWFAYVPQPAIAGVILLVAWRLLGIPEIRHIFGTSRSEAATFVVTFGTAILVNLEFAIYAGVILSLALYLKSSAKPYIGIDAPDPSTPRRVFRSAAENNLSECPQLLIARLDGPLYFGSVEFVRRQFRMIELERADQKHMIFVVKGVGEIDMPGADLLIEEARRRHRRGGSFHLQTRTPRTISKLARFHVMKALTKKQIHLSKGDAIAEVVPLLDRSICDSCTARIFNECPLRPVIHEKSNVKGDTDKGIG